MKKRWHKWITEGDYGLGRRKGRCRLLTQKGTKIGLCNFEAFTLVEDVVKCSVIMATCFRAGIIRFSLRKIPTTSSVDRMARLEEMADLDGCGWEK